jgi:3',5'-cyclic-nucleotide phosphodiesterase
MDSELRILGCSGGFGAGLRTTSFLWDSDTLIDAGTGVGDLSLEELLKIDQIFLTHSHLDHVVSIPFLADAVGAKRSTPITVYGLPETLQAFHQKIFHDHIWPDFTVIPSPEKPFIRFVSMRAGETIKIGQRSITSIPVNHVVPAVGYLLKSSQGNYLAFSGDTSACPGLWQHLSETPNLKHVLIECSFRNSEIELAKVSKHYCPSLLAIDLQAFSSVAQIHISHMKPGETDVVMQEINQLAPNRCVTLTQNSALRF